MKTVKRIHAIQARADRLNQPEMIERYKEMAISWDGDTCELIEEDHEYLNTLWNENDRPAKNANSANHATPCKGCRGL